MSTTGPTDKYLAFSAQTTKQLSVIVKIEGLDLLSSRPVYTTLRYGDPVRYGDIGLTYGGLRPVPGVRPYLDLDKSSLTISQRIEPEQGRASISQLTLAFIDKDEYLSQAIAPGVLIPDILGAVVDVYIGYVDLSYPEDFIRIFRGKISEVQSGPGYVTLQTSDQNITRRQAIAIPGKTLLTADPGPSGTTISVISTSSFPKRILGPDGSYDSAISLYALIDSEWINYTTATVTDTQLIGVTRGSRNTTAVAHAIGAGVSTGIGIAEFAMNVALKMMLSGWAGPWISGEPIQSLVFTGLPSLGDVPKSIILPPSVDAIDEYGLVVGDYVTISGATNGGNNLTAKVAGFLDWADQKNRIIVIDQTLISEVASPATVAFRSQYDTYPLGLGVELTPRDVDVQRHIDIVDTYLTASGNDFSFFLSAQESAKTFIENEIYLPLGCYSLTRYGMLSLGITKPPIADQRLQILDLNTIIDPQNMIINRGLNTRKFFNEIRFEYDQDPSSGVFKSVLDILDTESLSVIGISSVLPIKSRGATTLGGAEASFGRIGRFMLQRYKRGAAQVGCKVMWSIGSVIESGDVILIKDPGTLQVSNFTTGARGLGAQMYEVVDRAVDLKSGSVSLKLVAGVGSDVTDRFATISPSSVVSSGSTTTRIIIQDSYGAIFPGNEQKKWKDYFGLPIVIHSPDYSVTGETTLIGIDPSNTYALLVSPALSFTPPSGYIVDISNYPTGTDSTENAVYKLVHTFLDKTATVTAGLSPLQFQTSPSDIVAFQVGLPVLIHNASWSIMSAESLVSSVDTGTNTVTLSTALALTPSAGQKIELIGFADKGQPYRIL